MEICAIPFFDGDSTIISYFQAFCAGLPVGFQLQKSFPEMVLGSHQGNL